MRSAHENVHENVFIFNNIKNNERDIELLIMAFESLDCKVRRVENQKYDQLKNIANSIAAADFSTYNYIVVVILDNTNEDESIWITEDKKPFHTNGELITLITTNKHLHGKLRFSIIQTNRLYTSGEPILRKTDDRGKKKAYVGKDLRYYATSTGASLHNHWINDNGSPFIQILCNEIINNKTSKRSIIAMLDEISGKVEREFEGEIPAKTLNFFEEYVLGSARSTK